MSQPSAPGRHQPEPQPEMAASSALATFRAACGTEGPDLVRAVETLPLDKLDRVVQDVLGTFADPYPATAKRTADRPANELWPLVNARAALLSRGANSLTSGAGPAGVNIMSAMSPRDIEANIFSSGVLRALLYSHGLVLEDPLAMAAELHHHTPAATKAYSRMFVQAAVTSLVEIAELIDNSVVQTYFVPTDTRRSTDLSTTMRTALQQGPLSVDDVWDTFEANYIEGLKPSLRTLWKQIRGGDRNPPLDLVQEAANSDLEMLRIFVDVVTNLRPSTVIDNTIDIVSSALDDVRFLGWRPDVLCGSRLHAQLLYLGTDDPVQQQRIEELASINVPRLDGLAVSDVVKIRRLSDAFDQWRTDLSLGLDRAHTLHNELGNSVELAPIIAETLQVARRGVTNEAANLRAAAPGLVSFATGALGGAVGGVLDGWIGAAIGAAGASAGALANSAYGLTQRDSQEVLRRHYVLFDTPTAASA